jgi:branched-chain amino acid transport system substrate-binding protein
MKRSIARMLMATAFAGAMSCGVFAADDTLKIGYINALSGPLKGIGQPGEVAVDIAVQEINDAGGVNGKKIELIKYDTGSDPKQASVAMRKLAEDDKVLAVIGPISSGESAVALNDAERLHILMLPTSASRPGLTDGKDFVWRLTVGEDKSFARLLTSLKRHGIKSDTAAIVYVSDEAVSNDAGSKTYPAVFDKFGIKYDTPIAVQYKSFDVSAQIAKVMEQNPDLVAVAALPDPAAKVIHELRRQGYKGRIIGSQLFSDPNIPELFGKDGDGAMFVAGFWRGRTPAATSFNTKFVEETAKRGVHKLGAHHSDAQAHDLVYLVRDAIIKAKVTNDPAKLAEERVAIRDALKGIKFTGVVGDNLCFNGHDGELPSFIIELKDGQWTKFDEFPPDTCPAT